MNPSMTDILPVRRPSAAIHKYGVRITSMAIYGAGAAAARTHREYGDFTARAVIHGGASPRWFHAAINRRSTASTVALTSAAAPPLNMEIHHGNGRSMAPAR
jgi:hypothetical protein